MPAYSLITLSQDMPSEIPPRVIYCADDEMAKEVARNLVNGHAIAIWKESKLLAVVERYKGTS